MSINEVKKLYYTSLSLYFDYNIENTDEFSYRFVRIPEMSEMFAKYDLLKISGNGTTMQKARRIMQWIADNSKYDGDSRLGPSSPDRILEFAFDGKEAINCANRAILFADALVSIGVFAMPVWLIHNAGEGAHCHVVAQVWFPEMKCWGAFDPSFNTYFTHNGMPVSVPSMALLARKRQKYKAVSNETGYVTQQGFLCTTIGLMDISIFPGNDFVYRYHWNEQLHFVPKSYINHLRLTGDCDESIVNNKIIGFYFLTQEPTWQVDQ